MQKNPADPSMSVKTRSNLFDTNTYATVKVTLTFLLILSLNFSRLS